MSRFLMIDIGAGTMDILYFDSDSGLSYKSVARSPVLTVAERIAETPGNLFISGCEMGGGSINGILRERAEKNRILMTKESAMTLNHSMDRVSSMGIELVHDTDACDYGGPDWTHIEIADLDIDRLRLITKGMGIPFAFDIVGICAQDHGMPPEGISHLDYRHDIFKEILDRDPFPYAALYRADEVPSTLNRLSSIARSAGRISTDEIYVMDSGMAAIMGASMDRECRGLERIIVLDVATSHTLGAALKGKELAGFFEYHTRDISPEVLSSLITGLAEGSLEHEEILRQGGHGAYMRESFGIKSVERIVATGPKRSLALNSIPGMKPGAPLGDNMMTGAVGILESIGKRKGHEGFYISDESIKNN